jgi:hypothetical protein
MRREDCVEMFKRIPESSHDQINVVMQNRSVIAVDVVARFEPTYVVLRGREGGSTDEGRGFFIPYEEISYLRIERPVRLNELKRMYGEETGVDAEDRLVAEAEAQDAAEAALAESPVLPAPAPTPVLPQDPASIAKQNLLDRIRQARAAAGTVTGKLGK